METDFPVGHPLAVKLWSKKLFYESLKGTWAYKFMGKTSSSLCQIFDEPSKQAGDQVTYGLRILLSGDGTGGDGTLDGNEEGLTFYDDKMLIDQLRHAVKSKGRMSEQRVPYGIREEGRMALQDWWQERIDTVFFNQLTGNTGEADLVYTGHNATIAPDANHLTIAGGVADTESTLSATTSWSLSLGDIDRVKARIQTMTPSVDGVPMRPLRNGGEDYYCLFLHPYSEYYLRTNTNTGQWLDIQKAAMQGGKIGDNPIFTGALGIYNNVILHTSTRIPLVPGQTVWRRNVFVGAQALAMAFGQGYSGSKMDWVEEAKDYKNKLGVAAGMIFGMKKARFNSQDFGAYVISSYAPKP